MAHEKHSAFVTLDRIKTELSWKLLHTCLIFYSLLLFVFIFSQSQTVRADRTPNFLRVSLFIKKTSTHEINISHLVENTIKFKF